MKKIEYICNLCHTVHSDDSAKNGNIYAFFFNSKKIPQQYELIRYNGQCDTHICKYCVNVILNSNGKISE